VARLSADAIIQAWRDKKPARLSVGSTDVAGFTFNRSRKDGPVDTRLSVLRADSLDGKPFAMAFNYHTHINAHLDADPRAISRDLPGEVIDQIENRHPGVTALFLQGTCGDVMLRPEFTSTERSFEPGRAIAKAVLEVLENCRPVKADGFGWQKERSNCQHDVGPAKSFLRTAKKRVIGWKPAILVTGLMASPR
jgi:hypothetical protein